MAVKTFQVSTEYDRQAADARKRRRMADLLAQQVIEPTQYGPGPTPAAAPLVQGLQAFLAARAGRKADEAEEGVASAQARAGEQIAGRLTGGAPVREVAPPDASGLGEVKVESQYRASPEDAFRLALTPAGGAAMKGNPMLAAMLAQQMKEPTAEQFGTTPVRTKDGAVLIGGRGTVRPLGVELADEPAKTESKSPLARLLSEREGLPPDSPLRSVYDQAISKETRIAPGPRINVDTGLSRNQQFGNENTLRDEYTTQTADFRVINNAYKKIMTTADTGAGDMSLLYQYVKLLDPGSVVRESEFATAAASGSFGDQVQGAAQRIATGRRLTPELKAQFRNEAQNIFDQQQSSANQTAEEYRRLAEDYGLDPTRVVPGGKKPSATEPPKLPSGVRKTKSGVEYKVEP
jgi:hypothetical protein